ncbi:uncharacterized protein LOC132178161 [Corylus avellana]|uniref:uncharacterized protein LOC132178161 n=1 Tax=Corylus avellana TaxID=13451 RepID=UPI00286CF4A4|nr:uncharacterized protein LOC132178161 [Corylus avellana]
MRGKKGFMAIKLDMSKAYNRVEWRFLEAAMGQLGFYPQWIRLVMMCVTTVQYAVLVNGSPGEIITPTRGIRTNLPQWHHLTNLLRMYQEASGQRLNHNKTSNFFSRNTSLEEKGKIVEVSGIPITQRYDTYLGLLALVGKSRTVAFKSIIDRVRKKLQDWKLKFFSQVGNGILLKAVIQAIPTYSMNVCLLPKGLCLEINKKKKCNNSGGVIMPRSLGCTG